jgi:ribosomal protein S3AE
MVDYYQRKAKSYGLIKRRIQSVIKKEVDEIDVDDIIDEIVENERYAIGEQSITNKIYKLTEKMGLKVAANKIMRHKNE